MIQYLKKFNFNDEEWNKVQAIANYKTFQAEDLIIKEGERDRSLLIIKNGNVKVLVHHNDKPIIVATLSAGSIIGELNFTIPLHRSADVVAMDNTEVLIFNYHDLCEMLDADDNLAVKFFQGINMLLTERIYGTLG